MQEYRSLFNLQAIFFFKQKRLYIGNSPSDRQAQLAVRQKQMLIFYNLT